MNEQEEKKAEESISSTGDNPKGNESETGSLIEQANAAAERLELANAKKEELMRIEEEMKAKAMLGGKSPAGSMPQKPKELTPEEYANAYAEGKIQDNLFD